MKIFRNTVLPALLCAAVCITGCSSSGEVVRVYRDGSLSAPFTSILVVGIHEDADIRGRYERSVAGALSTQGTRAASSLTVLPPSEAISRDSLVRAAAQAQADAVLLTRLLDVQSRTELTEGRTVVDQTRRNNVPIADFFRYDYVEYQDPMLITTIRTVVLASDLYSVATEERVWSVESTAFDKESDDAILDDVSHSLTRALAADGLIR